MKRLTLALALLPFFGCGFKAKPTIESASTAVEAKSEIPIKTGFTPKDLKIIEGGKAYALLDVVTLPSGDYQLDNTVTVQGVVEFPYQYPSFSETPCTGLGYTVSYEARRKSATNSLKVIPYVNQNLVALDHMVVATTDALQLAVYGEYAPLSDYLDSGNLPNEFAKSFEPSNKCHQMCALAQVKPVRDVTFDPANGVACTPFWNTSGGGYSPVFPGTVTFNVAFFTDPRSREPLVAQLQKCGAVQTNDDLKNYYDQATSGPCQNSQKMMLKEWYFIEQKVPYATPVYSISNFSSIVKSTSETQSEELRDQSVHLSSDWSK